MSFLLAADLKERFYTEGTFYHMELNGKGYTCRGLAKISRRGMVTDVSDALFILVNPGSCQPTDEDYHFPNYNNNISEIPFVQANSDPTQYQIMRLMERMGWNMIYIINLSDLRAGNIAEFRDHLTLFEAQDNNSHSIFSRNRIDEVAMLLSEKTKIIAGWGTQSFMKEKMLHAISVLPEFGNVSGLPHNTNPYYYHPFPMVQHKCIKWLDDMCKVLEEADRLEREAL
jgi:hypothetical protein